MRPHQYFLFAAFAYSHTPGSPRMRAGSSLHVEGILVEFFEKDCSWVYISFIALLGELDEMTSVKHLTLDWHIENALYMLDPYAALIPQNTVKHPWVLEPNRIELQHWLITYLLGYLCVSFYVSGCPFLGWGACLFLFEGSFPYQTKI